jgi:hypothetical protein
MHSPPSSLSTTGIAQGTDCQRLRRQRPNIGAVGVVHEAGRRYRTAVSVG